MAERTDEINSVPKARLDNAIATGAAHMRPIFVAVRDAGCAFAIVTQGLQRFDLALDKPTIVLIGDDFEESHGPSGFHCKSLRRLFGQCRSVSIVACEPMVMAYAAQAATTAGLGTHSVIIETRARHEGDWQRFVETSPNASLLIATAKPEGGVH